MTQPPTPPTGPDQPGGYPSAAPQPPAEPAGFATPPPPADPGGFAGPPPPSGPPAPPAGGYAAPAAGPTPPAGGYDSQPAGYPPSQPAGYSPSQPAGYSPSQPPAARAGFDPSTVAKSDWAFFGTGFLMLIFSFFSWYSISSSLGSGGGLNGWSRWWVIIQLLLLASLGVRAAQVFAGKLVKEVPGIAQVGVAALMVVLYLIALIQNFANSGSEGTGLYSLSSGPGFGIWACLILSLGFVYFLALSKQKEGPLPIKVPGPANF